LRTVLASVGDLDRAKDLVDEAFARAWASWRKVHRHPAPRAWVVRTALNVGVSAWRRRRREVQFSETVCPADTTLAAAVVLTQQPGTSAPGTHLAAWAVTEKPPGIIEIKVRQLTDPAGMQRELRRDGVPAFVRFSSQNPPDCLYYRQSNTQNFKLTQQIFPQLSEAQIERNAAMVIDRAAIPPGVGLWIEFTPPQETNLGNGLSSQSFGMSEELVYASGRCPSGG
jgi:hypothetical protein